MTASSEHIVRIPDGQSDSPIVVRIDDEPISFQFFLGRGSRLDFTYIVIPGSKGRLDLKVSLDGEGAEANLHGLYLCLNDDETSIVTDVRHNVPGCISRQLFKGIAAGNAKTSFYGRIVVAQDAQKTEAYQSNHNILLSETARMETKPQLEIYADDVKCSHGATLGKLNEEEQFYMRSRGIPESGARCLQMLSFFAPVIETIPDDVLRRHIHSHIEDCIRSL